MFFLLLASVTSSADPAVPDKFEACMQAVEASSADASTLCDTAPYSRVHVFGESQNYRPACLEAMKAGPKWLEAKQKLPAPMAAAHGKKFSSARSQCVTPPPAPEPVPERKIIQLWD